MSSNDNEKERMNLGTQLKNKFNQVNDPILQKGDQYRTNETKTPKKSYPKYHHLAISEYEPPKPTKTIRLQNSNNIFSTDPNAKSNSFINFVKKVNQLDRINKRVFRDKVNKETQPKEIKTLKIFPESYKIKIKRILRTEENQEDDLAEKEGLKRLNYLQEQRKKLMTPSPVINQINDKKFLLPSDYENKYNIHLRPERPKSFINTAHRVFTEYALNRGDSHTDNFYLNDENINPNFKKTARSFYKGNTDSIGDLLAYKYAPEFRDQMITEKPNTPRSNMMSLTTGIFGKSTNSKGLRTFYNSTNTPMTNKANYTP